ncbi:hypothetical protein AB0M50_36180 [Nonomuraea fuscirosea]|jgi:hypothetical protein|uniref:hypothetical protein n=1 Tax=Nonomuraea fuscirosea TaxID=1291556 RepID=UPI00343F9FD7
MSGYGTARRLLRPARQRTYERIFDTVYAGLVTNVLLAVACLPLLAALAIVRDPLASWPFFALLSLPCGPALAGAFGCFDALGSGSTGMARAFWSSYRRAAPRALAVWAAGAAAVGVLAVDAVAVAGTAWGPALVPFFCTAAALVMSLTFALLTLAADPGTRLRSLLRPCLFLVARRWYLSAATLVVLALALLVVLAKPALGVLLLAAPLLYAAWATTRYVLTPILEPPSGEGRQRAASAARPADPVAPISGGGR